jgi:hypothetical protein
MDVIAPGALGLVSLLVLVKNGYLNTRNIHYNIGVSRKIFNIFTTIFSDQRQFYGAVGMGIVLPEDNKRFYLTDRLKSFIVGRVISSTHTEAMSVLQNPGNQKCGRCIISET